MKLDALPPDSNPFKVLMKGKWQLCVSETLKSVPDSSFSTLLQYKSLPASQLVSINYNCTSCSCLSHYNPIAVSLISAKLSMHSAFLSTCLLNRNVLQVLDYRASVQSVISSKVDDEDHHIWDRKMCISPTNCSQMKSLK